jgi:hypothetical protein
VAAFLAERHLVRQFPRDVDLEFSALARHCRCADHDEHATAGVASQEHAAAVQRLAGFSVNHDAGTALGPDRVQQAVAGSAFRCACASGNSRW